ncbi:MAG: hypothetical protein LIO38_02930, partial [Cloacibacillus sp.]|nr:hypothetical protein [Cloacibacillus sp.]
PVCITKISPRPPLDDNGRVKLRVDCRKGTYVRSFARDLGERLGSLAHIISLVRVSSGPFSIERAKEAEVLFEMSREELAAELIPAASLCELFPGYEADGDSFERLSHGQKITLAGLKRRPLIQTAPLAGRLVVASEKIFSICAVSPCGVTFELAPEVNIIIQGGGAE